MRVLTKSRFKLGLECPNKLYYTGKKEYANKKKEDPFLLALAEGGFQIEEYARLHFPGGFLLEGNDGDYEHLWKQTQELLQQENVIIYEAAFLKDNLFIRTDILVKEGNDIQLIEVKSKSFNPNDEYIFVGKRGDLLSTWKAYLFDIAFQKHVMELCFPEWNVKSFIMMADKTKQASIDGLNQMFRVDKKLDNRTGVKCMVDSLSDTGNSVLGIRDVSNIIHQIIYGEFGYSIDLDFPKSIKQFKNWYLNDEYPSFPTSFNCKNCEFVSQDDSLLSGFKNCFSYQHKWGEEEFYKPKIFDIWSFRRGSELFRKGIYFMDQLNEDHVNIKPEAGRLSMTERQWLQITKIINKDTSLFINRNSLADEMKNWIYPLHFIDFETSAVPLPFNSGRKPYEQIAFQFSLHSYYEDGRIEHAVQYLNNTKGVFPNFDFIRALMRALNKDLGTIFRYSNHENTILNAIYEQLNTSSVHDKEELKAFIKSISHSKSDSVEKWSGTRDMVDLWDIVKKHYYNPLTDGSNSLKDILPAILNTSELLQIKYSQPLKYIQVSSKNFNGDHIWLTKINGFYDNPYSKLPKLFEDWSMDELDRLVSDIEKLADGGAALTAYGKLQYTDISAREIEELSNALLKYCELDTLAMVMLFEHLKEEVDNGNS